MHTVATISDVLERFAPSHLAEEWDNVGLLVGDRTRSVSRVMTCLTITPASAAEAIEQQAELIVSHHPLPFRPLERLTTDDTPGRLLLDLVENRIAVYSPHTAYDSAAQGVNQAWADGLRLSNVEPLVAGPLVSSNASSSDASTDAADVVLGAGRCGDVAGPTTLDEIVSRVKAFLILDALRVVGRDDAPVTRVAIACGSGGSLLEAASRHGCDCFVTGEASFHSCLEAEALGMSLILTGHFASEHFAVERLAQFLAAECDDLYVWASRNERDPLRGV